MKKNQLIVSLLAITMTMVLWLGWGAGAWAHGGLVAAFPVPNEPVVNPTEVRLRYIEELAEGTIIQVVSWQSFKEVQQGQAQIDPATPTVAFVPLPPLEPGRYSVNWYVVMIDDSSAEGSYEFDVVTSMPGGQPPQESKAPSVPEEVGPPPAPPTPIQSRAGLLLALGGTLVLLLALLLFFMWPARKQDV